MEKEPNKIHYGTTFEEFQHLIKDKNFKSLDQKHKLKLFNEITEPLKKNQKDSKSNIFKFNQFFNFCRRIY